MCNMYTQLHKSTCVTSEHEKHHDAFNFILTNTSAFIGLIPFVFMIQCCLQKYVQRLHYLFFYL